MSKLAENSFPTRREILGLVGVTLLSARRLSAAPIPRDRPPILPITITEEKRGKFVTVPLGREVVIELEGRQVQTGWELIDIDGTGLKPVKVGGTVGTREIPETEFRPFEGKSEPDPAVGTYRFRFKAVTEGSTDLGLRYIYPGGPVVPARIGTKCRGQFTVTVDVAGRSN